LDFSGMKRTVPLKERRQSFHLGVFIHAIYRIEMEVETMYAQSETSRGSSIIRLAFMIGCIGALILVVGIFNTRTGAEEGWEPLNEELNAVLGGDSSTGKTPTLEKETASSQSAASQDAADTNPSKVERTLEMTSISAEPSDDRIDINHATAQQLDELPGIGPAKAAAIVADRELNGPFRSVDDLDRVKGIGPKMLEKLRASVVALP
jgi:competence protein ComEA